MDGEDFGSSVPEGDSDFGDVSVLDEDEDTLSEIQEDDDDEEAHLDDADILYSDDDDVDEDDIDVAAPVVDRRLASFGKGKKKVVVYPGSPLHSESESDMR